MEIQIGTGIHYRVRVTIYQMYNLYSRSSNTGGVPSGDVVEHKNVTLPYFNSSGGPASEFFNEAPLPQDGWVLIARNFGLPYDSPILNDTPRQPYYVLYNKMTGIIRIFFYQSWYEATSYFKISLNVKKSSSLNTDDVSTIFTYERRKNCCMDDYYNTDTIDTWNGITSYAKVINNGWSHADFVLGYDPVQRTDLYLQFKFFRIDETQLSVEGKSYLNQITHQETVNKSPLDILGAAFDLGGSLFKAGRDIYNQNNKKKSKEKSAALGTAAAIFSAGNAVAKFIKALQPAHISVIDATWYESEFTGTMTCERYFDLIGINLPGSNRTVENIAPMNPIYDRPLGIFVLKSKPKVALLKTNEATNTVFHDSYNKTITTTWNKKIGLIAPLQVEVNDIPGCYISNVDASFVWEDGINQLINGDNGLRNFKQIDQLYDDNNVYSGSLINLNAYMPNGIFKIEERFRNNGYYWFSQERKVNDESTGENHKFLKPSVQIVVEVTSLDTGMSSLIVKTYDCEFSSEIPDSSPEGLDVISSGRHYFQNRDYRIFKIFQIPQEYGTAQNDTQTISIVNNSLVNNLILSGNPPIDVINSDSGFICTKQPARTTLTPGQQTVFEITYTNKDIGVWQSLINIPYYYVGSDNQDFIFTISGETLNADLSQFNLVKPTDLTYSISGSTDIGSGNNILKLV